MNRKVKKLLQESDYTSKNDILMCTIEKTFLLDELKVSLKTSKMDSSAKLIKKTKRQRAKKLNLYENEQLNFICKALSCFKEEGHLKVIKKVENPNDADFFGSPDIYAKNTILFCKQLDAFNCLNLSEQLAITKKATYDIWSLRFIFNYNPETQGSVLFQVIIFLLSKRITLFITFYRMKNAALGSFLRTILLTRNILNIF